MRKMILTWVCGVFLCCSSALAQQDPYLGEFATVVGDSSYRLNVDRVNSTTYDGLYWVDDEKMQLDGRRYGEYMVGRLANEQGQQGFRARIHGSTLVLETENSGRVVLYRKTAPKTGDE